MPTLARSPCDHHHRRSRSPSAPPSDSVTGPSSPLVARYFFSPFRRRAQDARSFVCSLASTRAYRQTETCALHRRVPAGAAAAPNQTPARAPLFLSRSGPARLQWARSSLGSQPGRPALKLMNGSHALVEGQLAPLDAGCRRRRRCLLLSRRRRRLVAQTFELERPKAPSPNQIVRQGSFNFCLGLQRAEQVFAGWRQVLVIGRPSAAQRLMRTESRQANE